MTHVFISYVRENQLEVDRLADDLRNAGVDVWLDREQIAPGRRWQRAIRTAIVDGTFLSPVSQRNTADEAQAI